MQPHNVSMWGAGFCNCCIHPCPGIVHTIEETGAIVLFLPPYSPDSNPIEETFSKVKTVLKSKEVKLNDVKYVEMKKDVETLFLTSFTSVTPQDCKDWMLHSGIYIPDCIVSSGQVSIDIYVYYMKQCVKMHMTTCTSLTKKRLCA